MLAYLSGFIKIIFSCKSVPKSVIAKEGSNDYKMLEAAKEGKIETVKSLVSKGANLEAKDKYGYTALVWASITGHLEVVRVLREAGARE